MTWKRVVTAAILIPIVVALVLFASTAAIALAIAVFILLALFEYFALGDAIGHRAYRFWTAACALLLVFVQYLPSLLTYGDFGTYGYPARLGWLFSRIFPRPEEVFFVFVLGIAALTIGTRRPLVEGLPSAGISSSALLLVAFPLTYAIRLHAWGNSGPILLLFALVITWVGDSVAYFVGRAIGKHASAPHLSPKKTWEGAVGSFAAALITGAIFSRWLDVSLAHLLIMAAVANIAGQIGDLLESAYKRSAGVKDSGGLLPGHGGVLDRIDALILTFPVIWYYWTIVVAPRT
jgi:phosphatidate cytidylyltransferase